MHLGVIRVSGIEFNPEDFAKRYRLEPDISWRAGEPDPVGRVRSHSGFNLTIANEPSVAQLIATIRLWVQSKQLALQALESLGGAAVLDVGVTVGTADQFTSSVEFPASDLSLFAESKLALCLSAYPSQDEE